MRTNHHSSDSAFFMSVAKALIGAFSTPSEPSFAETILGPSGRKPASRYPQDSWYEKQRSSQAAYWHRGRAKDAAYGGYAKDAAYHANMARYWRGK